MICISRCKRKGFVNQEPPTGNIVFVHVCLQVCYFLSLKCCLGLQFKNPNVAGEMAQLIMFDQETYVPCTTVNGKREILTQVPLHGDQLFEERARNVKWTFQDGTTKYDRLEGMTTEAADWHAKLNLYSVRLFSI